MTFSLYEASLPPEAFTFTYLLRQQSLEDTPLNENSEHASVVDLEWSSLIERFQSIVSDSDSINPTNIIPDEDLELSELKDVNFISPLDLPDLIYEIGDHKNAVGLINNEILPEYSDDVATPVLSNSMDDLRLDDVMLYSKEWLLRLVLALALPTMSSYNLSTVYINSQCEKHIAASRISDQALAMDSARLCTDIFTILRSEKDDSEIQNALVDLIGYDNFEFLTSLITNRGAIVRNIIEGPNVSTKEISDSPGQNAQLRPRYGTQVSIQTESEKQQLKVYRKKDKSGNGTVEESDMELSAALLGFDSSSLREAREYALMNATKPPLPARPSTQEKYPNIYTTASSGGGSMLSIFGTRYSLPIGTKREDHRDYEEIMIPVSSPAPVRPSEKPILITDLEPFAQAAFKGYKSLNRVQSIVFPVAYGTNENMLVCAPTGAGKTDVAMLTILRTLSTYQRPSPPGKYVFSKSDFKIIYVAPMKALAAEVVRKFSSRLAPLDIQVRELTGDMQLSKNEILNTQIIVTTPEKWDVVTRKATGDNELSQKVRLIIIDEVHLLHEDRGAVLESIVARTQRQVETSQSMIRIVGLSATLPNYIDVAGFLRVNPYQGLFFFDSGFRPIPLGQHFVGVKGKPGSQSHMNSMNRVCYEKVHDLVRDEHQVMVFVHSRKDTVKTARTIHDIAIQETTANVFDPTTHPKYETALRDVAKSRNRELKELFAKGFAIHHAGMLRSDRTLVERLFADGVVKVLCCTATLAWGVNLPAYAVVIKGTQVYDTQKGSFVDLSILDVLQIFGRAGRPQFEAFGLGYILTSYDKLQHYVSAITQQIPIESQFAEHMVDNLNAEIALGTVTNIDEAVQWLGYTYLFIRMKKNPLHYGMNHEELFEDPLLGKKRRDLIVSAANVLYKNQMIILDENTGILSPKDLGRIASNYYIRHTSVEIFNNFMRSRMTEADVLAMVSQSTEFENVKLREEEVKELKDLMENACYCAVKGGTENAHGKVNILLQEYISRAQVDDFSLVSDTAYVAQNSGRILRALFEIALNRSWGPITSVLLSLAKSVDKRMWSFEHPLAQFDIPGDVLQKLENQTNSLSVQSIRDMSPQDVGALIRHHKYGPIIHRYANCFPLLELEAEVAPITRNVLRIQLEVTPDFVWNDKIHGSVEPFWIWVEDAENTEIYHSEYIVLQKRQAQSYETIKLGITIPVAEPLPPQIYIRAVSDRWIGSETVLPVSFQHLILPEMNPPQTELLDLQPLPVSVLENPTLEEICRKRFEFFNPIQTQTFFTLYHTEKNVLLGAPTGSGKTMAAELAMWAAFRDNPQSKVVYIAPLKALVRERVIDWRNRLVGPMNRKLVELTGDVTPDLRTIETADIIITTPEKWDGISRHWQSRSYVRSVACVIIDEIHLLGGDRGPILEVIVSRMNYISSHTNNKIRIVGLSTALANAQDLADWLSIKDREGMFNFKHSVRPVPLEIHIDGFPGKHYCPRMATMNKPAYAAIMTHSPEKPVIVFVSSRRQTRLTAQDLIALCAMDDNPRRFVHIPEDELEMVLAQVKDSNLRHSLGFGIGLHHAGLAETDRRLVEELFVNLKIQILVATSTLAWGVNTPAHLVVIKGTEFYDAKTKGYVDFPITDVLQMMGRAGRPQYDDKGIARIFVHDVKKNFYKKFLHQPFPVESSLQHHLHDHINAEIASGTIKSKQDAVDYLTWTYLFRRLQMNPSYYGCDGSSPENISVFLSNCVEDTIEDLSEAGCVEVLDDFLVKPTVLGNIASYYYLSYKTIKLFHDQLRPDSEFQDVLEMVCMANEYSELPVRHNEDLLNRELAKDVPFPVNEFTLDSPHTKAHLLLQAHFSRLRLPISDYITDTVSVLDQSIRIIQAMIDVAAEKGFLATSLIIMNLLQCIKQGRWLSDSTLLQLPRLENHVADLRYKGKRITALPELYQIRNRSEVAEVVRCIKGLSSTAVDEIISFLNNFPRLDVTYPNSLELPPAKPTEMRIQLKRSPLIPSQNSNRDLRLFAPHFPKIQFEGWFVVIGDVENGELISLKRVSMRGIGKNSGAKNQVDITLQITLSGDIKPGQKKWTLFVMSDGYLGIDQICELDVLIK
ncbi:Sec63 Brl domain-containing protein [Paraphysoderma sedebokerense]|nr:Sec63 Brl domain-containing protein [Paraphysoderma sedebokerense]